MRSVGVFEAKNRLTALLSEVENGGEIVITRRGKPIARLTPMDGGFSRTRAQSAAAGLLELGKTLTLDGLTLKDLVDEGRR